MRTVDPRELARHRAIREKFSGRDAVYACVCAISRRQICGNGQYKGGAQKKKLLNYVIAHNCPSEARVTCSANFARERVSFI